MPGVSKSVSNGGTSDILGGPLLLILQIQCYSIMRHITQASLFIVIDVNFCVLNFVFSSAKKEKKIISRNIFFT